MSDPAKAPRERPRGRLRRTSAGVARRGGGAVALAAAVLAALVIADASAAPRASVVTLKPAAGPAGTTVTVDGNGFPAGPVTLHAHKARGRALAGTRARRGRFHISATIPRRASGLLKLFSVGGGRRVVNRFLVSAPGASDETGEVASSRGARLLWSPLVAQAGETVRVRATGLGRAREAQIVLADGSLTAPVARGGSVSASLALPVAVRGIQRGWLAAGTVRLPFSVMVEPPVVTLPWPEGPRAEPTDTVAPSPPVIVTPAEGAAQPSGTVVFSGTAEPGARIEVLGEGVVRSAPVGGDGRWSVVVDGVSQGTHAYTVRAVDAAGNVSVAVGPWRVTVDLTAPDTTITAGPAVATRSRTAAFSFSADDAYARFECRLDDGAWEECGSAREYSDLADGAYTFAVRAFDAVGNRDPSPATGSWTVDTTPPSTTITAGPAVATRSTTVAFSFSADDAYARFECRLDDGAWEECGSPREYSDLADGAYTFAVRAFDAVGNVESSPQTRSWRVDTVRPTNAAITTPASGTVYTQDATVPLLATAADDVGVTRMEFRDNGVREFTTGTSPFRFNWKIGSQTGGRHRWTVRAFDAAGNASPISSEVVLDVNIVAPAGETEPVPHPLDAADDPAVWIDRQDPGRATIIGTDKLGGLAVYDLAGKQLYFYADSTPNNVDLRYGFMLGDRQVDVVVTSDRAKETSRRGDDTLRVYAVDPTTRGLDHVGSIPVGADVIPGAADVYGVCLYRSAPSGRYYAFATYDDGAVRQWELVAEEGRVTGRLARDFGVPGQRVGGDQVSEGCVADDELGRLYVSEEDVAIWRFGAEPDSPRTPDRAVDGTASGGHLTDDIEGLALYQAPGGAGYLLASSQGSDDFAVYERGGDNRYVTRFGIGAADPPNPTLDRVDVTDGIEVVSAPLGAAFPKGLFVAQDNLDSRLPEGGYVQNFKLVGWERIAGLAEPLLVDATWTPW